MLAEPWVISQALETADVTSEGNVPQGMSLWPGASPQGAGRLRGSLGSVLNGVPRTGPQGPSLRIPDADRMFIVQPRPAHGRGELRLGKRPETTRPRGGPPHAKRGNGRSARAGPPTPHKSLRDPCATAKEGFARLRRAASFLHRLGPPPDSSATHPPQEGKEMEKVVMTFRV